MTLQELLKKHNVEEGVMNKILADMKANKIYTTSEENIDIRYPKLKQQHAEATNLIAELQKAVGGNKEAAEKVAEYESKLEKLESEKKTLELDSAVKFELLANGAKADDLDYLMFKVKQNEISVDEKGALKGLDVKEVQTAYPNHFTQSTKRKVEVNKLQKPDGAGDATITKEQFKKMGYNERTELKSNSPDLYTELTKK